MGQSSKTHLFVTVILASLNCPSGRHLGSVWHCAGARETVQALARHMRARYESRSLANPER